MRSHSWMAAFRVRSQILTTVGTIPIGRRPPSGFGIKWTNDAATFSGHCPCVSTLLRKKAIAWRKGNDKVATDVGEMVSHPMLVSFLNDLAARGTSEAEMESSGSFALSSTTQPLQGDVVVPARRSQMLLH